MKFEVFVISFIIVFNKKKMNKEECSCNNIFYCIEMRCLKFHSGKLLKLCKKKLCDHNCELFHEGEILGIPIYTSKAKYCYEESLILCKYVQYNMEKNNFEVIEEDDISESLFVQGPTETNKEFIENNMFEQNQEFIEELPQKVNKKKCKFGSKCNKMNVCRFIHPPKCRFGDKCRNIDDCYYSHY